MIYSHNLGYEDSLTRDIFLFFDDHIEELEECIVGRCQKIDMMFGTGEFDAHFVDPLLDDLDVKEAWQILHDTWDESQDTSLWKDERNPDTKLIVKAAYTYGKNLYELICGIYDEIGDAYEEGVAEKGCDGGASTLFMKAYTVVKEIYVQS
jgi:hypothetical protein